MAASREAITAAGGILRENIARCPFPPSATQCPALDKIGLLNAMEQAAASPAPGAVR